jgi:hypothetical protein
MVDARGGFATSLFVTGWLNHTILFPQQNENKA